MASNMAPTGGQVHYFFISIFYIFATLHFSLELESYYLFLKEACQEQLEYTLLNHS
jgi:hypothetical protein